jgi:predicted Fe-S protein YdhL (DUF1289 family)
MNGTNKTLIPCKGACEYVSEEVHVCKSCGRSESELNEWWNTTMERKREIVKEAQARLKEYGLKD